jgi:hypothetical protein
VKISLFGGGHYSTLAEQQRIEEFEFYFEVKLISNVGIIAMYAISTIGETKYYYHCRSIL